MTHIQSSAFAWRYSIAILPIGVLAAWLGTTTLALDPTIWVVGVVCNLLYILAVMLAGPVKQGLWTGFASYAIIVNWLAVNERGALMTLVVGSLVGVIAYQGRSSRFSWRTVLTEYLARISISGWGLLAAWAVAELLGQTAPLLRWSDEAILPLLLALLVNLAVSTAVGLFLTKYPIRDYLTGFRPTVLLNGLLQLIAPIMPLVLHQVGLLPFVLLMGLPAAQTIRFNQLMNVRATLLRRIQEMTTLNTLGRNMMFMLDSQDALRTAVNIAKNVTQADYVGLFVLGATDDYFRLIEEVGFAALADAFPHYARRMKLEKRIVNDINECADEDLKRQLRALHACACIEVPVRLTGAMAGYLAVYHRSEQRYELPQVQLLELLADQLATALDNADLLSALEQYAAEQAQLIHVARTTSTTLDLTQVAREVCETMMQITQAQATGLLVYDEDGLLFFQSIEGVFSVDTYRIDEVSEWQNLQPSIAFEVLNLGVADALSAPLQRFMASSEAHSIQLIPMTVDHDLLGALVLAYVDEAKLVIGDHRLVEMATYQIAAQIYNARSFGRTAAALRRRLEQLALLEQIAAQITQSENLDTMIHSVLDALLQATQADHALMGIQQGDQLRVLRKYAHTPDQAPQALNLASGTGILGYTMATGEEILCHNITLLPQYVPVAEEHYRSLIVAPLRLEKAIVGALMVESERSHAFSDAHLGFVRGLAGHAAISIENARLEAERDTLHDAVAHDIRSPASIVATTLDVLSFLMDDLQAQNSSLEREIHEMLHKAQLHNDKIVRLAQTWLDVARGHVNPQPRLLSLRAVIEDAIATLQPRLENESCRAYYTELNDWQVYADSDMLSRVLINLIDNAAKYSRDRADGTRGTTGEVLLTTSADLDAEGRLCIYVSDSGKGIPNEARHMVFEKFYQTEGREGSKRNSIGIGLTFCKMAVEAHQGKIWVEPNGRFLGGACIAFNIAARLPALDPKKAASE